MEHILIANSINQKYRNIFKFYLPSNSSETIKTRLLLHLLHATLAAIS
jgi:hypothetical protein